MAACYSAASTATVADEPFTFLGSRKRVVARDPGESRVGGAGVAGMAYGPGAGRIVWSDGVKQGGRATIASVATMAARAAMPAPKLIVES